MVEQGQLLAVDRNGGLKQTLGAANFFSFIHEIRIYS